MPDCVIDATVVAFRNEGEDACKANWRLVVNAIDLVVCGDRRVRYNAKLLDEYARIVNDFRDDIVEAFFQILDSDRAVKVNTNKLRRHHFVSIVLNCRWPSHDQHLIAAAIGGED